MKKIKKIILVVILFTLFSCGDQNSSNLALTCKNFYEGQKLYHEQKQATHSENRNWMKPNNKCMDEIKNLCGIPHQVGVETFISCMDKKQQNLSSECLEFHKQKQAAHKENRNRMKPNNKCFEESNKVCKKLSMKDNKEFINCIETNMNSFSKECQQFHKGKVR